MMTRFFFRIVLSRPYLKIYNTISANFVGSSVRNNTTSNLPQSRGQAFSEHYFLSVWGKVFGAIYQESALDKIGLCKSLF